MEWSGGVAHDILVSAQGPFVLVLRLRVWGQGLTTRLVDNRDKPMNMVLDWAFRVTFWMRLWMTFKTLDFEEVIQRVILIFCFIYSIG